MISSAVFPCLIVEVTFKLKHVANEVHFTSPPLPKKKKKREREKKGAFSHINTDHSKVIISR